MIQGVSTLITLEMIESSKTVKIICSLLTLCLCHQPIDQKSKQFFLSLQLVGDFTAPNTPLYYGQWIVGRVEFLIFNFLS